MTITEAARLVMLAGSFSDDQSQGRADVFVLDMGKPVRIRQLAEQMIHAAGYSVRDERNPEGDIEIRVIGLRPGEKLHEELLIGGDALSTPHPKIMRVDETRQSQGSVAATLQELGRLAALGDAEGARALALGYVIDRPAPVASPNAITAASWS
jgi:FlaA1/EpsC-like NDP-sugar epimerase